MFTFGLLCFTSFFTLINPLGAMPVFMTMTMELDEKERRKVARRASLVSFLIMMFFAISGDLLFRFFGISIDSLRIVGGIIFLIMGMDMLQARLVKTKVKESEVKRHPCGLASSRRCSASTGQRRKPSRIQACTS